MEFDKIMRIKTRADEKKSHMQRLEHLVNRSLLLEEAIHGDSYKSVDFRFNGMDPNLVIPTSLNLSISDSVDLLNTLLSKTDEEILRLQTLLDL